METMRETTVYFKRLETGEMAAFATMGIDIIFPIKGFEPKEGVGYFCDVVRQPESPRHRHNGRDCVVCTAIPVGVAKPPAEAPLGEIGLAFAEAARRRNTQKNKTS